MSLPISRREFFKTLVPSWATRQNLLAGAIGAGAFVALAFVVSVVRDIGFFSILRLTVIGFGLLGGLGLALWIAASAQRAFRNSPPVVQAAVTVMTRLVIGVAVCGIGALAYERWRATEDKTGFFITAGTMVTLAFVDEWKKRRANVTTKANDHDPN